MRDMRCVGVIKYGTLRGQRCNFKFGEVMGNDYLNLLQCRRCKTLNRFTAADLTDGVETQAAPEAQEV